MNELYRQTLEYQEGRSACREGERRAHNPYASGEKQGSSSAWWMGWDDENDYQLQIADDLGEGESNDVNQEDDGYREDWSSEL